MDYGSILSISCVMDQFLTGSIRCKSTAPCNPQSSVTVVVIIRFYGIPDKKHTLVNGVYAVMSISARTTDKVSLVNEENFSVGCRSVIGSFVQFSNR